MTLNFELGNRETPRGHAVIYAKITGGEYVATYCIVMPISFSVAKYLPQIFSGQLGAEAEGAGMGVMPIPPMLEDVADIDALRALARRRGDDLCDLGTITLGDDSQRLTFAAQACAEYGQLYTDGLEREPLPLSEPEPLTLDDVDVDAMLTEIMPERSRLGEMARLIGVARYALDGHDQHQLDDTKRALDRIADSLPEKYRGQLLAKAALTPGAEGQRLADLYLRRAYKLLDEDYASIPPLDEEIRSLAEHPDA